MILKWGFRIYNRTRNPKTDFNAEISVLTVRLGNPKRMGKTVLKNSGLVRARIIIKAVHDFKIVLQILFWISKSNGKKEIHGIRIWIS